MASEAKENGEETTYFYDDLGRLTSETLWNGMSLVQRYAYTYDDFGNRATLTATGADAYTTTYTYNLANRLTSEAKTQSGATSTTTYTYDANGNQLKQTSPAGTTTNTYNSFNQLITSVVDGTSVSYTYTPSGLRFTKRGITYLYDGDVLALELRGTSNTHKYTYGVDLISCSVYNASSSPQTTEYYYLRNGHGDVTYLTDAEGAITKTYEYDAFGNEENPVSTDINPFRYAGEYYDAETGTYYLRARYYDPVIGRFTQEDPHWNQSNMLYGDDPLKLNNYTYAPSLAAIIQSGNLYVYAMSNPTRYTDPSGEIAWIPVLKFGAGVVIDGALTAWAYNQSGKSALAGFVNGAVSGAFSQLPFFKMSPLKMIAGAAGSSGLGSLVEELGFNAEKSMQEKIEAIAISVVKGALSGLPSAYIKHSANVAKDVELIAANLMVYDKNFADQIITFYDKAMLLLNAGASE